MRYQNHWLPCNIAAIETNQLLFVKQLYSCASLYELDKTQSHAVIHNMFHQQNSHAINRVKHPVTIATCTNAKDMFTANMGMFKRNVVSKKYYSVLSECHFTIKPLDKY